MNQSRRARPPTASARPHQGRAQTALSRRHAFKVARWRFKELRFIASRRSDYFITVHDIVKYAEGRGHPLPGAWLAANSAVCYVLGVTAWIPTTFGRAVEPLSQAERREPPDIDVERA